MTTPADLEDRLAARLLGVDVDAEPGQIRAAFRRLARAVHPDTAVGIACVDLGRLAVAKQRLLARAEATDCERLRRLDEQRRQRAQDAARDRLLRARREQEARRRVERLRLVQDPVEVLEASTVPGGDPPRRRSASAGRVGLLVDLAG